MILIRTFTITTTMESATLLTSTSTTMESTTETTLLKTVPIYPVTTTTVAWTME